MLFKAEEDSVVHSATFPMSEYFNNRGKQTAADKAKEDRFALGQLTELIIFIGKLSYKIQTHCQGKPICHTWMTEWLIECDLILSLITANLLLWGGSFFHLPCHHWTAQNCSGSSASRGNSDDDALHHFAKAQLNAWSILFLPATFVQNKIF